MSENPKFKSRNSKHSQGGRFDIRASRSETVLLAAALGTLLAGCAVKPERLRVCPGKANVEEALQTLAARAEGAVPLRVNGQGMLRYYVPKKSKPERHNLPMQMWFDPPANVYIQGSIVADPRAVILGSNSEEFWLALSPKEMSSYYIGRWRDVQGFEGLVISPRVVLEALGIIVEPAGTLNTDLWSLQNKGPYDVLTRRDEAGRLIKRVYVYACDYVVHKVEYYDRRGKIVATATLGDYEPVTEGFSVPTRIAVESLGPDKRKDSIRITLNSPKRMKPFTEPARRRYFVPPDPNKFEHVYRYEEGRWVPE